MPGIVKRMRECLDRIPDPINPRDFNRPGGLMPGLVAFSLGMPSLLLFDKQTRRGGDPVQARTLRSLFGVETPPSDSCC